MTSTEAGPAHAGPGAPAEPGGKGNPPGPEFDRGRAIAALEAQLAATPRRSRPRDHAVVAYRLGMAYAESPLGDSAANLRRALASYEVASSLFDPELHPVEHGRVLNAAGAARRLLGEPQPAAALFARAASLMEGGGREEERAAALNNLGLVRTELGHRQAAMEAFDEALGLFDQASAEGRRGRVATLHNRGLALVDEDTETSVSRALQDYRAALSYTDTDDAPYHYALVQHSMGIALSRLAALEPDDSRRSEGRTTHLLEAIGAFGEALSVFTRSAFPYQHALAKHNQGLAWLGLGGTDGLRRALACFEDAVAMLDPRIHADAWRQSYASLTRVEETLQASTSVELRAAHFAALLASCGEDERRQLLHERLARLLVLPAPRRRSALAELALGAAQLGASEQKVVLESELAILMEQPPEGLAAALQSQLDAHRHLQGEAKEAADRVLDQAVGDALVGPQRMYVRDYLASLGFERP